MPRRVEHRLLVALLIMAAAVRLIFFWQLKGTDLAVAPMLDSFTYHQWALRLAGGDWGWNETYWMGPLYPHLLALVYTLAGPRIVVALALQLLLSLVNVWLTWRLARRVFGDEPRAAGAALLATAVFAGYGAPMFYAGQLLMATLTTTLLLLTVIQVLRALARPTPRAWLVTGVLVGLTGLSRGNNLILLAALPLLLWRPGGGVTATARWRLVLALGLGGLLVLAPVTLRNLIVADDFVLLTSNGGINLLIGQQHDNDGRFALVVKDHDAEFDPSMEVNLELEQGRDLKGSEISRILTRRAWRQFRDNLSEMPRLYLLKAYRFWNGYELPQIIAYEYWKHQFSAVWVLPVPFVLLSALGLLGLRFLPPPARAVVVVVLVAYFLSMWPFFPTSRYRQPIAPVLAIATAAFVLAMVRSPARRRVWLPAAAALTVALLPRWGALDATEMLWQVKLHQLSRAGHLQNLSGVLAHAREADQVMPDHPDTPFLLALYLENLGALDEAVAALRQAEIRAPTSRLVPYVMARNLHKSGHLRDALAALDRATALDSTWAYPWHRRALVLNGLDDRAGARAALETAHRLGPGNQRIRANLAALYAEAGELDRALELLDSLTRDYPHYVNGWFNLALAHRQAGQTVGARTALARAAALRGLTGEQREQIARLSAVIDTPP